MLSKTDKKYLNMKGDGKTDDPEGQGATPKSRINTDNMLDKPTSKLLMNSKGIAYQQTMNAFKIRPAKADTEYSKKKTK